ncbi:MAG TPA: nuclear transport factor 2 family protein [Candidatus Binataceae bacterium]|nr:nuclear transport factor 2 family protein [Candidatus Binataceae bacterium]
MTREEELIRRYFDAFNQQNLDGVVACFHPNAVLVDAAGKRTEGYAEIRRHYQQSFAVFPDGRCELRLCAGNNGGGVAESRFHGTRRDGSRVEALGAEVVEIADGLIREIRDYHRAVSASAT